MRVAVFATSFRDDPVALDPGEETGKGILDRLATGATEVSYRCDRNPDHPVTADEVDGVSVVIADLERWGPEMLAQAGPRGGGSLRLIVRYGVGFDSVDIRAATEAGVMVCNTPGANSRPTAEWTVTAMLIVLGRALAHHGRASSGRHKSGPSRVDLSNKTVGLVGTGAVSRNVVQLLGGFGPRFIAADPLRDDAWAESSHVTYAELDELLRESDIVTLHASSREEIIGQREIDLFKPKATLINCARGHLVDNRAVWKAVKEGDLWGYAIDEVWPHPDFSLEGLNILVSPHVGSDSEMGKHMMQRMSALAVEAFLRGEVPPNLLNPEVLPILDGMAGNP